VLYGALVLVALALPPGAGLVVAALALLGHGAWDVWHLRRHRDQVSPSLAEACVALDVPAGLAVLALAVVV
jgi:TRAP-type C4-dicarboxylate transport system permease small subunit